MITRLSTEAVIAINQKFCGAGALLSWSDIDSAANQPYQSAFGDDAYVTIFDKAAVLLAGVAKAHAFVDGNKRTGWTAAQVFLDLNRVQLRDDIRPDWAGQLVIDLVEHKLDRHDVARWLTRHAQ